MEEKWDGVRYLMNAQHAEIVFKHGQMKTPQQSDILMSIWRNGCMYESWLNLCLHSCICFLVLFSSVFLHFLYYNN